jgi:hypothetical protein
MPAPAAKKGGRGKKPTGPAGIHIVAPQIDVVKIAIRGTAPLIVHAWSIKAIRQMLYKQMKISESGKEAKSPQQDFNDSRTFAAASGKDRGGWDGMPCTAFKCAFVEACRQVDGLSMTAAQRLIFIEPDGYSVDKTLQIPETDHSAAEEAEFGNVPIVRIYGEPRMRTDMVRIDQQSTADVRFRAEYREWRATLTVRFNANQISGQQIMNLCALAGMSEGVGEWRPSAPKVKSGVFGTWEVIL